MEAAAEELEVDAGDLETDGKGSIRVKGAPHRSISVRDVAIAAQFRQGKTISGRGIFLVPLSDVDPETGEMSPATCYAHACLIAEVEVDDETGEVAVLKMTSTYEIGRAINPKLVEQQLVGGSWMGMSHALYETPEPYYPNTREGPRDFNEYLMPGPGDICPHDIVVLERPAPDGPYGAKGPGEMCANPVLPAVANAIFNAVGVRINDLPITPEKVLRALRPAAALQPAHAPGNDHGGASKDRRHRQPARARGSSAGPPIISPTKSFRPPPISRSRSASLCCSKALPASARPKPPRRSPACSAARCCGCNATKASTRRPRSTNGIFRARCSRCARRVTRRPTSTSTATNS